MPDGREPLRPESFRRLLDEGLPHFGGRPPEPVVERLASFLAELDRWRRRINLTGRLSPSDLVSHTGESLLGARFLPQGARLVDIGTGGGFPGVPIAIARPDLRVTWLEPRQKRAAFLRHVARAVSIPNARTLVARLKDLPRETFDCATLRAVSVEAVSLETAPFLEPGGALVLWTTDFAGWSTALAPSLQPEQAIPVPGSRARRIAVFRKG